MKISKTTIDNLERALIEMDQEKARKIVMEAVETHTPIETAGILISQTLSRIGDSWEKGEMALSQVYMSSIICEKVIDTVLPPQSPNRIGQPKMAIGLFEDFHMLGKRIVYSTLRASGIELIDLGGGLSIEKTIKLVKENNIEILLLSVLMLPSALRIKELMKELKPIGTKVVVGGAPFRFDSTLATDVGVEYFGNDSAEALSIINSILDNN